MTFVIIYLSLIVTLNKVKDNKGLKFQNKNLALFI